MLLPARIAIEPLESRTLLSVSFSSPITSPGGPAGSYLASVATGDFNKDGRLDAVVSHPTDWVAPNDVVVSDRNVSVLLGNGSGGFGNPVRYAAEYYPNSVAVGDLNDDGNLDLVTANFFGGVSGSETPGSVSVLLGNGTGGFAQAVNFAVGSGQTFPLAVAIADFNGDGKQDVATANWYGGAVGLLLGNGAGGFAPAVTFPVIDRPAQMVVSDFNGDGRKDIAVSGGGGGVGVLLNNGLGGFAPAVQFANLHSPEAMAVGDLNGDGRQDLVTAHYWAQSLSVLWGNGTGGFSAPSNVPVDGYPTGLAIGDFNADGRQDIAVTNSATANDNFRTSVLEGNGTGGFAAPVHFAGSRYLASGDFNSDAHPDLITTNYNDSNVNVLLNTSDSSQPSSPTLTSVLINNGNAQRSMVWRVAVTFSEPVTLSSGALAIRLSSGTTIPATLNIASSDQQTYTLTFSGSAVIGGSLPDGIYDLIVSAAGVQDFAGNPLTGNYTQRFHRLFGDSDGNRVVNSLDYARLKQTFGRAPTDPLFNSAFDYDGNNLINALDLARFRQRYGLSYSY